MPAPISYSLASRNKRPVGYSVLSNNSSVRKPTLDEQKKLPDTNGLSLGNIIVPIERSNSNVQCTVDVAVAAQALDGIECSLGRVLGRLENDRGAILIVHLAPNFKNGHW